MGVARSPLLAEVSRSRTDGRASDAARLAMVGRAAGIFSRQRITSASSAGPTAEFFVEGNGG